jgi:hypothetical protein
MLQSLKSTLNDSDGCTYAKVVFVQGRLCDVFNAGAPIILQLLATESISKKRIIMLSLCDVARDLCELTPGGYADALISWSRLVIRSKQL